MPSESTALPPHDASLDVAVIAMSGRFPDARTVEEYWRNLVAGRNCITRFTRDELEARGVSRSTMSDPQFVPCAPVLPDHPGLFDAEFFGFAPREAELLDPQHRLLLECAWEVLELAGYDPERYRGSIGVFAASSISAYLLFNILTHRHLVERSAAAQAMFGNDKDFASTRISYELNLRGPSMAVQTACSSSLVAIHVACQALLTHECDMALAGGVSIHVPQRTGYHFVDGGYHSPDGCCRPFDAGSAGVVFGSGGALVLLKRVADAVADGDAILAVVRGTAINNDGSGKVGFTAPSVAGQAEAIARAYAVAAIDAATVGYVEAHGTATELGDLVEIAALREAFAGVARRRCALGSVKANIGHLDAAAGVAGFIKAVLAVRHGLIPPTLHFETPNTRLNLDDSPFHVAAAPLTWTETGQPRRAGVSSFGIGGTNAHAVVEEPPPQPPRAPSPGPYLLALSARTPAALDRACLQLADHVEQTADIDLGDASFTLLTGRRSFPFRRVGVCGSREAAIDWLRDRERMTTAHADGEPRSIAFLFPGGGAQHPLMAAELYRRAKVFRDEVDGCAVRLQPILGLDLRQLLYPAPPAVDAASRELEQMRFALPALLTLEYALARLWMSWGVTPSAMLGHSLGEYAAALIAGVFSPEDALALVARRGALLDRLPRGAMLSVACSPVELEPWLDDGALSIAVINAPEQCVVSGSSAAIDRLSGRLTDAGVMIRRLHLAGASHSPTVEPILREFEDCVASVALHRPQIPYVSCSTGEWILDEQACSPRYWVDHLRQPVQFSRAVRTLVDRPRQMLLEVGPGQTLTSLVRLNVGSRSAAPPAIASLPHAKESHADLETIVGAAGAIWAAGGGVDWERFFSETRRRRIALPTYPFERKPYWIEPSESTSSRRDNGGAKSANVDDWFYVPTWKRQFRPAAHGALPAGASVLLLDGPRRSEALHASLVRSGARVITVRAGDTFQEDGPDSFVLRPDDHGDYRALIGHLRTASALPGAIVHAWTLGLDDANAIDDRGFHALVGLTRALDSEAPGHPVTGLLIADRMFNVSGGETADPRKAMLMAPCIVIGQEHARMRWQGIDVGTRPGDDVPPSIADAIVDEIREPSGDTRIAYRGRCRWVESYEETTLAADTLLVEPGGVYWITGGTGRVGLRIAEYLARRGAGALVLIARSGPPDGADWRRTPSPGGLADAEAWLVRGDVADAAQLHAVAETTHQRFGRLDGIVHAAGVSGQRGIKLVAEITREDCAEQFRAKRDGVAALAGVAARWRPRFCLLVSSNASVLGGVGAVAYAGAHMFQDAFAIEHDGTHGVRWISVNWDGWPSAEGDMTVGHLRTTLDRFVMAPEECAHALDRVFSAHDCSRLVVSTGSLDARLREWIGRQRRSDAPAVRPRAVSDREPAAPETELERAVVAVWQESLGIADIGANDNFFDLGGNSLIALKVVSRLSDICRTKVPLTAIFEGPTPRSLARLLGSSEHESTDVAHSHARGASRRARRMAAGRAAPA